MKSDSAMWGSLVIVEHLRTGVSVAQARTLQLGRALTALLNFCGWEVDEFWQRQVDDAHRTYVAILIERTTGRIMTDVVDAASPHLDSALLALKDRSWEKMRDLPDPVWEYLSAITGATRDEWAGLVDQCESVLGEIVTCPACQRRQPMPHFGKPDELQRPLAMDVAPFHAVGSKTWLVFTCPDCGARVQYDIEKRQSAPLKKSMWEKSSMYRWTLIVILGVLIWTAIAALIRR